MDIHNTNSKIRRRQRPMQEQRFSNYLSFGFNVSVCMGVFLGVYALVLLCASPLLQQEAPATDPSHMRRGQVLKPVVNKIGEKVQHLPGVLPRGIKDQLQKFRQQQGQTDTHLINKAEEQFNRLRKERVDAMAAARRQEEEAAAAAAAAAVSDRDQKKRTGFMVVGMHRSGTSMLSGLFVNGMGYHVGGPLIGSASDNEKGFFERVDAVLQNDEFMNLQRVWWSANVINYDWEKALQDKESGKAKFSYGKKALAFLNNPDNTPWLQKDPRMCITIKTWLKLLNHEPAVLWTYRHPMEVAHSLMRREPQFRLDHVLRLWIVYNMRGLQNIRGLCRVYSSNDKILGDTLNEVQRLSDELTSKCGVPSPPNKQLSAEDVEKFVDTGLQHNTHRRVGEDKPVIAEHGDCKVHDLVTDTPPNDPSYQLQKNLYLMAMKLFCDMESGNAYDDDYDEWPRLP